MKKDEINLYNVDLKYIRDLSKVDSNVMSVSPQIGKESRSFIGVIVVAGDNKYCIPLTSPFKEKFEVKSKEDFIKIPHPDKKNEKGAPVPIGILNINNMIPVSDSVISVVDLSNKSHLNNSRKNLLINELKWCRENADIITNRANRVYRKVTETPELSHSLTRRCLKFKKLEEVLAKRLVKEEIRGLSEEEMGNRLQNFLNRLEKSDLILRNNPQLSERFNMLKQAYFKKNLPISLEDRNAPVATQLIAAKLADRQRSEIIKSDKSFCEDYTKARDALKNKSKAPEANSHKQDGNNFPKRRK